MALLVALLVVVLALCAVVGVALEVRRRKASCSGTIPELPYGSVFGNIDHVAFGRCHVLALEAAKKYGGVVLARVLFGHVYLIADGEEPLRLAVCGCKASTRCGSVAYTLTYARAKVRSCTSS
jgi:hypothetical protein